ncbi:MAG: nucleotidyltransferase domain-containing protein [Gallionella sp.]|nr:nucleotidyltransferase domain-containing protein [Gallionella sp.]
MCDMPAGLDITDREWATVSRILKAVVPDSEVWAFGSRVQARAKPYSDLDLALLAGQPLSLETRAMLTEAFEESDLPFKVDVVDLSAASPGFCAIIESRHLVVQSGA